MRNLFSRVRPRRRALTASVQVALLTGALTPGVVGVPSPPGLVVAHVAAASASGCPALRRVLRHDARYMASVLEQRPTLPALVAARDGRSPEVVTAVERLGGRVEYRDDTVDYLRVTLPTSAFWTLACSDAVATLEVDGGLEAEDLTLPARSIWRGPVSRESIDSAVKKLPPGAAGSPSMTMPLGEMGVDRFLQAHPTFDGRGVTVAFIEWAPDMLDVQTWSSGSRRTKVLRPIFEWPAPPHRSLVSLVPKTIRGPLVAVNGQSYRVPPTVRDREVLVGAVDERQFGSYYGGDLNRDGNVSGASPSIGILRDPAARQVWVDTQQNHDWTDDEPFACEDEPALTLGRDDPRTPQRESMAVFVLCETDRPREILFVPTGNRHITTLAATAAAAALPFGGHGIAPGVSILPVLQFDPSQTSSAIEAALRAFRDPRADILTIGLSVERRLHDGRSVVPLVLDRAVRHYQKLLFSAAGNTPIGFESVSEIAMGDEVVTVGAYASPEAIAATHGIADSKAARPYWLGKHGPRADGQIKPDLIATAAAYLPSSGVWPTIAQLQRDVAPGYTLVWGTSQSAPAAAAAAALLLSGARQSGISPSVAALRAALIASARQVPGYGTVEQGAGLLTVPAAWDALQRGVQERKVEVRAPVTTRLTISGDVSPVGPGLFEREGWTPRDVGKRHSRTLVLTRRDGPPTVERFRVSVIGDRESFVTPSSVMLPLNAPIDLPVQIEPSRLGSHAVILRFTETGAGRASFQVPLTVVVANELSTAPGRHLTLRGVIPFPHFERHFIRVPEGVESLTVEADAATAAVRPRLMNPAGQPAPYAYGTERGPWRYGVERPEPGVWELVLNHSDGANFGLPTGEQRAPAAYHLTINATPASSPFRSEGARGLQESRVLALLDKDDPFASHEFYVSHTGATIDLASELTEPATCRAEHRLVLERCERGTCSTALGSETVVGRAKLRLANVARGEWRAVLWRASPDACQQTFGLRVAIDESPGRAPETAQKR
jgi:hypothetical protein